MQLFLSKELQVTDLCSVVIKVGKKKKCSSFLPENATGLRGDTSESGERWMVGGNTD